MIYIIQFGVVYIIYTVWSFWIWQRPFWVLYNFKDLRIIYLTSITWGVVAHSPEPEAHGKTVLDKRNGKNNKHIKWGHFRYREDHFGFCMGSFWIM